MPICKLCNDECDSLHDLAKVCTLELIRRDHPEWVNESGACPKCKAYYERLGNLVSEVSNEPNIR